MRQRCDNLAKLISGDMAEGINEFARCKSLTCADCLAASSTELPFPMLGKGADATAPLHLIPMDVCGPSLDDYSKMSIVRPIARKSEVPALVKEVVQLHRVAVWARLLYCPH